MLALILHRCSFSLSFVCACMCIKYVLLLWVCVCVCVYAFLCLLACLFVILSIYCSISEQPDLAPVTLKAAVVIELPLSVSG